MDRKENKVRLWVFCLGIPIWIIFNVGAICFGTYFPPIWNEDTRVRAWRVGKSRVPLPLILTPLWILAALIKNWVEYGAFITFGALLSTGGTLLVVVSGIFALHRIRRPAALVGGKLSRAQAHPNDSMVDSSSTGLCPPK